MGTEKKSRWKLALNIITILALIGVTYAIRHQILDTFHNLARVNAGVLFLILPLEAWNYDAYAKMYRAFFRILGVETTYKEMFKVSLELNLINHIFPTGGVSGFSYFSLRLRSLGISTAKATLVQTMRFIFLFLTYEVLLVAGLFMLAVGGHASNLIILVSGSLATLLIVATFGLAFIIESQRRIQAFFTSVTRLFNRAIHFFRPKHPETINIAKVQSAFNELHDNYMLLKKDYRQLKGPLIGAFLANLTELTVIYVVYIAFGHWVNPGAVILAYAVANFAGLISVLPGGLGIYEALMTAVLAAAGIPPSVSLPVTVMYRVISITIQVIPGYYFYHKALGVRSKTNE